MEEITDYEGAKQFFLEWRDYVITGQFYEMSRCATMEQMYQAFAIRFQEEKEQGLR